MSEAQALSDIQELMNLVADHGAYHDDDCPGDDTCACTQSYKNKAIQRACVWLHSVPALTSQIAEAQAELDSTRERLLNALHELRCPDCGCADQIDAESHECGCDSPVCARDGRETLATAYVTATATLKASEERLAAEREAVRVLGEAMFWSREYASNAVPTTFELMRRAREAVEGNPIARAALTPPAPAQEPRA